MIELRAFLCFACVAQMRSFSRAADHMGMAQSNLSAMIGRLERRLGGPLFIRRRTPMELTALGERLLPMAADLARQADLLEQESRKIRREAGDGVVIVGNSSTADVPARRTFVEAFLTRHPGRSVHIIEMNYDHGLEALKSGEADFMFSLRQEAEAPCSVVLAKTPLRLLVPIEHKLAALESIPLAALAGVELLDWCDVPATTYREMMGPLIAAGALIRPAIEVSVRVNIQVAARRRLVFPILDAFQEQALPNDMVVKPIETNQLGAVLRLLAHQPPATAVRREIWALAHLFEEQVDKL